MMYYEYTKSIHYFLTEFLAILTDSDCLGVIIWIVLILWHYCCHNEESFAFSFRFTARLFSQSACLGSN